MNRSIVFALSLLGFLTLAQDSFAQGSQFYNKKVAKLISQDMKIFNSEGYNEREVGSAGDNKTSLYIASQFKNLNLEPKGDNEYSQNLNVPTLRMAQGNSSLMMDKKVLTLFSDYYPVSTSSNNGRYKGEAVNVGYGIDDAGLDVSSYKGVDVTGKAVIINISLPGDPSNYFKFSTWESIERRVEYAKSKGAKAAILYSTNPDYVPSGTLEKIIKNSRVPVLFVSKDLTKTKTSSIDIVVDILILSTQSQNILGFINNNAKTTVVISTHHDNTYDNYEDLRNSSRSIAVFLALAKEIKTNPKKFVNNNYLFASFTGYEDNYLGANYFFKDKSFESETLNYMISIDDIGNLDSNYRILKYSGLGTSSAWPLVTKELVPNKINEFKQNTRLDSTSESTLFHNNGIPVLSVKATSKYTEDSKRPKAGIQEAQITNHLCKLVYGMDKITADYSLSEKSDNSPEQVFHKIPFSKISNFNK